MLPSSQLPHLHHPSTICSPLLLLPLLLLPLLPAIVLVWDADNRNAWRTACQGGTGTS